MKNKFDEKLLKELVILTKVHLEDIPLDEKKVIEMFSRNNVIKDIYPISNHSLNGISECSTIFYNNQIKLVNPISLNQISKLIAFAHSSGAWNNNASDLLTSHNVSLDDMISTKEDLFDLLINSNIKESIANEIVEKVSSGKLNLPNEKKAKKLLIDSNIPKWVLSFLNKVQYLPKREIINEITLLTYRLAWFKKKYTKEFYQVLFQLSNNEELLNYKDLKQVEILKILTDLKNNIYENNLNNYNNIKEYNNDLINISHRSTLLLTLMEIRTNQTLINYLLKDIVQ